MSACPTTGNKIWKSTPPEHHQNQKWNPLWNGTGDLNFPYKERKNYSSRIRNPLLNERTEDQRFQPLLGEHNNDFNTSVMQKVYEKISKPYISRVNAYMFF